MPTNSTNNFADALPADSVFVGQSLLARASCTVPVGVGDVTSKNVSNLSVGKGRSVMGFSPDYSMPSLRHFVGHIVGTRADEPVARILARWVVASVKHLMAVWNRPDKVLVPPSVRSDHASASVGISVTAPKDAVSVFVQCCHPRPAFVGATSIYLRPVASFGSQGHCRSISDYGPTRVAGSSAARPRYWSRFFA